MSRSLPGWRERMNQAMGWSSDPAELITGSAASPGMSDTRSSRLATSTSARSMSVPTANSSSISPTPSSAEPTMRLRPSSPLNTSSCWVMISRSTSAGAAPGQ